MSDLEEFGSLWRYKCPFEGCDKNTGRAKSIGYKEFAIHSGEEFRRLEICSTVLDHFMCRGDAWCAGEVGRGQ